MGILALLAPMKVYCKEDGADWAGDGYDDQETDATVSNYFLKVFRRILACRHAGEGVV